MQGAPFTDCSSVCFSQRLLFEEQTLAVRLLTTEILLFSCKKHCHRHILWRKPAVLTDSSVALVWSDIPARLQGLLLCCLPSSSEWVCSDHQCFQQPGCKKASYSSPQVWGLWRIPGDVAEEQDACNRVILPLCLLQHYGHINFCVSLPAVFLRSWCNDVQTAYGNHNLQRKPSLKQLLLAHTAPFCSSVHQAWKQNAVRSVKDLNFFLYQSLKSNDSILRYLWNSYKYLMSPLHHN